MPSFIESLVIEVLTRYGDRALYVLKAGLELLDENRLLGKKIPGDFDGRSLNRKLREWGISYNPNQLLRTLERDYGIIETTYRSSTQRWWRFVDEKAVRAALKIYEGDSEFIDDPEIFMLELQVEITNIDSILRELKELVSKSRLSLAERQRVKDIVINVLPEIVKVYKQTIKHQGKFKEFNTKVITVMKYSKELVRLIKEGMTPHLRSKEKAPTLNILSQLHDDVIDKNE
jgi:hypothetical protein